MKRTKVIEFIGSLGDGGAETLVKDYVRLVDSETFEVSVVIIRDHGPSANGRQIRDSGVPIIPIYTRWNLFVKVWNKVMGMWYVPYKLRRIVCREGTDVLHVHLALLKYVSRIGKPLDGLRLFFTCHNVVDTIFGPKDRAEKKAAEYLIKRKRLQLVALHQDMANELNQMFAVDNTVVIRNGIDFPRFVTPGTTKREKRFELGIPDDSFVMGHVGRFSPQKNHMFLVEIFKEVAAVKPNAFLLMVGAGETGPVEDKLQEYGFKDRYLILSHRSDVNQIMQAMDVFVFPSVYEGLGIVMIEAQVSGLKCVASDAVPSEAFKTPKAISLPLGDARKWAEVILDDNYLGSMNGDIEEYDMNREIKRLEKLYLGELNE